MASFDLKDKVALITGGSSGIGAATAVLFSRLGVNVAITGRKLENLQMVAKQCEKEGKKAFIIVCDLTKEDHVKKMVDTVIAHYNKLDILVNSAGIIEKGTIETTSLAQFDSVFNINVRSMYHVTMLAVPHLIKTQGCIVNVSSVNGVRAFPGVLAYCMSKSAVDQMTRCVALELASKQVRVNSVNPGVIKTNIHLRGGMTSDEYEAFLEHSKTTHALGRPGEAKEVARTIAFLASDGASFITGTQVPIDGGRHAMCPR